MLLLCTISVGCFVGCMLILCAGVLFCLGYWFRFGLLVWVRLFSFHLCLPTGLGLG